jgi:L-galactono-1,4-lactone dehydrogenase
MVSDHSCAPLCLLQPRAQGEMDLVINPSCTNVLLLLQPLHCHQVLGFECGGSQWVNEVAMPAGTLDNPSMDDIACVEELLGLIESRRLPAPSPIEQRWTSRSESPMSVASDSRTHSTSTLFSWIGIIMYLCVDEEPGRVAITDAFARYRGMVATELDDKCVCDV